MRSVEGHNGRNHRQGDGDLIDLENYRTSSGRYWIGVGPEVAHPDYNTEYPGKLATVNASQFKLGTEIDVVLSTSIDGTENLVYIECILGDVKAHTDPDGIFQTGRAYKHSGHENSLKDANGSYIEFINDYEGDNGIMSDYYVVEIIIYEREW